ncbi:MAG: hypothetical protein JWQ04_2844 [Pedosphaera sp.]|nr:hypothetical protein [Pedosphaera sp.]
MSTAERIYEKAQALPQPTQEALLQIVELLASEPAIGNKTGPKAGSAKGLVEIRPDFDEPLEDFKPYRE